MLFKNLIELEGANVSVVPSANLEAIKHDLNKRNEAYCSRN